MMKLSMRDLTDSEVVSLVDEIQATGVAVMRDAIEPDFLLRSRLSSNAWNRSGRAVTFHQDLSPVWSLDAGLIC